jgi:hypothetical protein
MVVCGMKSPTNETSADPRVHCENLKRQLTELAEHLRKDVERVDDARFKALCETSAEVVLGLRKAFEDYGKGDEPAWRGTSGPKR